MTDFVGKGWAWPVTFEPTGAVSLACGTSEIEQAMLLILLTVPGERVLRPLFGCRIHELVFASNNSVVLALAERYVEEALTFWEPRIRVYNVKAAVDEARRERLLIVIRYEIKATYDRRSLVFPFYTIPGEPPRRTR